MSGSTIGGFAGAIVGSFIPVVGTQLGFVIGSAIGGAVDPEKFYGPRIGDGQRQTVGVGASITYGWGIFPTAGHLIWQAVYPDGRRVREVRKKQQSGKSGPKTYTYHPYSSYAIGICRAKLRPDGLYDPIAGVVQVTRNGKVVYNVLPTATAEEQAGNAKFLKDHKFYLGGDAQLPPAVMESFEGVGNVPGHKDWVLMEADDVDLTDSDGSVPQYGFVVAMGGEVTPPEGELRAGELSEFVDAHWPLADAESDYTYHGVWNNGTGGGILSGEKTSIQAVLDFYAAADHGSGGPALGAPSHYIGYAANSGASQGSQTDTGFTFDQSSAQPSVVDYESVLLLYQWVLPPSWTSIAPGSTCPITSVGGAWVGAANGAVERKVSARTSLDYYFNVNCANIGQGTGNLEGIYPVCIEVRRKRKAPRPPPGIVAIPDAPGWYVTPEGEVAFYGGYTEVSGTYKVLSVPTKTGSDPAEIYTRYEHGPVLEPGDPDYGNAAYFTPYYDAKVLSGDLPAGWTAGVEYPVTVASVYQPEQGLAPTIAPDKIVLAEPVAGLLRSDGLVDGEFDVSQLTDLLDGYSVSIQTGVDALLAPLMKGFFFDAGEWDDKLHFVKRGGDAVANIPYSALVAREGPAIKETIVQEIELLHKVNVIAIDPAAGYVGTKQTWSRRSSNVAASGEQTLELPIVIDADLTARIAAKRGKVAWSELRKFDFGLPASHWPALTATDVANVEDSKGRWHRQRLMRMAEADGIIDVSESVLDRRQAYTSAVTGVVYPGPTPPPSSLAGPSLIVPINVSPLRDQDDHAGIYIGVAGLLRSWPGGQVEIRAPGGTWTEVAQVGTPATIGFTKTALGAEDPDTPSQQSLDVYLPDAPESVDYGTLLRYANRIAVVRADGSCEILQHQTVTVVANNHYRLSGLVRGRYNTGAAAIAAGARVVVIDSSLLFLQAQQWMIGQAIEFRAIAYGTSADDAEIQSFSFAPAYSQVEWPVHNVQGARDGSDNVTVTWQGRPRLGTSLTPYHSQHFAGYRVRWDDGSTVSSADTTASTYIIPAAADPIDITVTPLNAITGEGPASEAITL